jgi:hypothetical protein
MNFLFPLQARLVLDEWKELGDDGKGESEATAKKDKSRDQEEMADYTPPLDEDEDSNTEKKPEAKRTKKDPK